MPTLRTWSLLLAGALVGLCAGGCERYAADEVVESTSSACCKVTSEKMDKSAGCRVGSRCKNDEPIWMNGNITCTPVKPDVCLGGRCCEYRPRYGAGGSHTWEQADAVMGSGETG